MGRQFYGKPSLSSYEWNGSETSTYRHVDCCGGNWWVEHPNDISKLTLEVPSDEMNAGKRFSVKFTVTRTDEFAGTIIAATMHDAEIIAIEDLDFPFSNGSSPEAYEWSGTRHSMYTHVRFCGGFWFVDGCGDNRKFVVEVPSEEVKKCDLLR